MWPFHMYLPKPFLGGSLNTLLSTRLKNCFNQPVFLFDLLNQSIPPLVCIDWGFITFSKKESPRSLEAMGTLMGFSTAEHFCSCHLIRSPQSEMEKKLFS